MRALAHDVVHGIQGFLGGLGHHHALAGSQAVGLDHQGRAQFDHGVLGFVGIGEDLAVGRGHTGAVHDVLGEGLAAFQTGTIGIRTEAGDAGLTHAVGDALGQGQFGTGHHQVDLFLAGQFHQAVQVSGVHRHVDGALTGRAAVAGGHKNFTYPRALLELPHQGVLTPARTDNQDAHNLSSLKNRHTENFPAAGAAEKAPSRAAATRNGAASS